jgi:aspartate carbamoyltransferase regulatory subunit
VRKELKVSAIQNGTVIDHITEGMALKVLHILGIDEEPPTSTVSVIMHVPSRAQGHKDIVKIEDRELKKRELNRIALLSPNATINIIRDGEVAEKHHVRPPREVVDLAACENPNCITNTREPVPTRFKVMRKEPMVLKCSYCGREQDVCVERLE